MKNKIDVLFVEPNKLPIKKTIDDTLKSMQELVGGRIEYVNLPDCEDVFIICNEEGKMLGLPLNREIGSDIIAGNFFIVGNNEELGETCSLTQQQIDKYTEYFNDESIKRTNQRINEITNNSYDYDI